MKTKTDLRLHSELTATSGDCFLKFAVTRCFPEKNQRKWQNYYQSSSS